MDAKITALQQLWDFALPKHQSRDWVLSAMKTHGPALVRLLWRILGCEQDVCDAYQEVFLKLSHFDFGKKPEKLKAYMFKTASNTAISILRRKKTRNNYIKKMATKKERFQQDPQSDFDQQQVITELREAVMRLPENFRNVILLKDFGEMNYCQIAKILNTTEATTRVYRCKAVQLLSLWMNKE